MAPVVLELQKQKHIETLVCLTGQHRELLDQAIDVFSIKPDFDLDIMRPRQTLAETTSAILVRLAPLLEQVRPDRVLVHGDTTTAFASAVASFYARTPIGHVEAGLRTGNLRAPWPEEYNRRAVDMISDLLWAPTLRAAEQLRNEGVDEQKIRVTGNTVVDALQIIVKSIENDPALRMMLAQTLPTIARDRKAILVTGHRRESFDGGLSNLCQAINVLASRRDVEVVWPVHLNPRVMETVLREIRSVPNVHLLRPTGYVAFVELMRRSCFIITDSGGIQEEAPSLSKPVLVTRSETERPEAAMAGAAKLVGIDAGALVAAAEALLDDAATYHAMTTVENPFGDGRAASRIVANILETHGQVLEVA